MYAINKFQNVIRALLQEWGSARVKKNLWNREFSQGRWDYIDSTPEDCVYYYIEKYCRGGSILDLGCGSGNTGNELSCDRYGIYTGIDISDVAIQKAITRSRASRRRPTIRKTLSGS